MQQCDISYSYKFLHIYLNKIFRAFEVGFQRKALTYEYQPSAVPLETILVKQFSFFS